MRAARIVISFVATAVLLGLAASSALAAASNGLSAAGMSPGQTRTASFQHGDATTTITIHRLTDSQIEKLEAAGKISPNNITCPPDGCGGACGWVDTVGVNYAYEPGGYQWTADAVWGYSCNNLNVAQVSDPSVSGISATYPYEFPDPTSNPTASVTGNNTSSPTLNTSAIVEVQSPYGGIVCQGEPTDSLTFSTATQQFSDDPSPYACTGY